MSLLEQLFQENRKSSKSLNKLTEDAISESQEQEMIRIAKNISEDAIPDYYNEGNIEYGEADEGFFICDIDEDTFLSRIKELGFKRTSSPTEDSYEKDGYEVEYYDSSEYEEGEEDRGFFVRDCRKFDESPKVDEELLNEEGRAGKFRRPNIPEDVETYLAAISKLAVKLFSGDNAERIEDDIEALYTIEGYIYDNDVSSSLKSVYQSLAKSGVVEVIDNWLMGLGNSSDAAIWCQEDRTPFIVLCYDYFAFEIDTHGCIYLVPDGSDFFGGERVFDGGLLTDWYQNLPEDSREKQYVVSNAKNGYLYLRDLYKRLPGILNKVESILDSFEGYEDIFDVLGESKKRVKESADLDCCAICYGKIDYDDPDSYTYPESGPYEGELVHTRCLKKARRPW